MRTRTYSTIDFSGPQLSAALALAGLTQRQLAEAAGCSYSMIVQSCRGARQPSPELRARIRDALLRAGVAMLPPRPGLGPGVARLEQVQA